jgi:hypothetical protein
MSTRQEHQLSSSHEIPYYELEAQWTRRDVRDATRREEGARDLSLKLVHYWDDTPLERASGITASA